jgi:uncharacterized protein YbaP (TraB family)
MKNFRRRLVALLLGLIIVFPAVPVFAQENDLGISDWAIEDISDSQYIGILEISEETLSMNYLKDIDEEILKEFIENFDKKLESTGVKRENNFENVPVEKDLTRERVLLEIYNVLGKYDSNITAETNPIEFFSENGILKGKGSDNKLEDIATIEEALIFFVRSTKYFYEINDLGGRGVFYKVENDGNTVYLFGSIHLGDNMMYPIEANRLKAFEESDKLFVELDVQDQGILAQLQKYQTRSDGKKLKDELGEELYAKYQAIAESLGLKESDYENLEGWAVLNQLTMIPTLSENPYGSILGVDNFFISKSKLQGKPVISLETVEIQMDTLMEFYGNNKDVLLSNIEEAIEVIHSEEKIAQSKKEIDNLKMNWNSGEADKIGELFEEDESSKILTSKRDPEMARQIIELLESDEKSTSFVLVGAGHYAPEGSVVDIIKKAGYTVESFNN